MRNFACLAVALAIGALTAPADAAPMSYSWTDQDITFTLDVEDFGTRVDALLRVDRTADADTDLLKAVAVKIFSDAAVANAGILVSATNVTDSAALVNWTTFGDGVGGQVGLFDTVDGLNTGQDPSNNGFFAAAKNELGGEVTDKVYEFLFRWDPTSDDPLGGPSIKAITVELASADIIENLRGVKVDIGDADVKSRQWSSGPLGDTPVPEPGTFVLVALGAAGYVVARRRKRS